MMNTSAFRNDGRTYDLREFAWIAGRHMFESYDSTDEIGIRMTFEI